MRFANRHRLACSLVGILLFVTAAYVASGLTLKSSLKELLPENSPSVVQLDRMLAKDRRRRVKYRNRKGQYVHRVMRVY